jgi:hypothetical protein
MEARLWGLYLGRRPYTRRVVLICLELWTAGQMVAVMVWEVSLSGTANLGNYVLLVETGSRCAPSSTRGLLGSHRYVVVTHGRWVLDEVECGSRRYVTKVLGRLWNEDDDETNICWRSIQTGAVARRKNSSYYSPRTKRKLAPGDAYIWSSFIDQHAGRMYPWRKLRKHSNNLDETTIYGMPQVARNKV